MPGEADGLPRVSVVIPSVGAASLGDAVASVLESARRCGVPTEVVVAWQPEAPPALPAGVRVVPTHRVNVSYARNRGVEAARAGLVGMVDEDEVVDPRWVGQLVTALADADAAFGPIDPIDEEGRPHCLTDHGEGRLLPASTPPWLVGSGGNMGFRRPALEAVGGFDLRFGAGAIALSAEETDLIWRLLTSGKAIRWAPDMVVHHPTKTDAEILASRYPYGHGSGRVLRRSRSPRLIGNYLHAVVHANVTAVRRRDRVARREAAAFGRGLVTGLVRDGTWMSPDLGPEELPSPVRAAVGTETMRPLPVSWGARPHYVWIGSRRVLHAYVGPTEAQASGVQARLRLLAMAPGARIPAVHAHAAGRDALWVLEDRVDGTPLVGEDPATWWPAAAEWILGYSMLEGPPLAAGAGGPTEQASWVAATPAGSRGAVAAALERLGDLPSGPSHGDAQPKNLLRTPEGLVAGIDWEWCSTDAVRGMDLLFLAVCHAGAPQGAVVEGLRAGRNPAFGDVLGPLARLGLEGARLQDTITVLLAKWAANELRRMSSLGDVPPPEHFGELLALLPAA